MAANLHPEFHAAVFSAVEDINPKSVGNLVDAIGSTIRNLLKNAKFIDLSREQVVATAKSVYNTLITPINLQWVPDSIEPMVDQYFADALGNLAGRLYDQFLTR